MNPWEEKSNIHLPVWMPDPKLMAEKAAKGSLLELLGSPGSFCPRNIYKCGADGKSMGYPSPNGNLVHVVK